MKNTNQFIRKIINFINKKLPIFRRGGRVV